MDYSNLDEIIKRADRLGNVVVVKCKVGYNIVTPRKINGRKVVYDPQRSSRHNKVNR